ncbi:MAG: hypothetical protein KAT18_02575 [Candidatus Latescibacteria bacterium]|nr:hypothetical protein [Candidatus Latescibacterota bacterium]
MNASTSYLTLLACGFAILFSTTITLAQEPDPPGEPVIAVSLGLGMSKGRVGAPFTPEGEPQGLVPYDSGFFMNMSLDVNAGSGLRLFFGMAGNIQRKLLARAHGVGNGLWVFEQSGYESHSISFADTDYDVHMFMDTAGFRLGAKLAPPNSGTFVPWVGISAGIYLWTVDFANTARDRSYGSDKGVATGITYMGGIDLRIPISGRKEKRKYVILTPFVDLASPVAYPKIENLFLDGWTWDNVGGSHVMGPTRFGVMLGTTF